MPELLDKIESRVHARRERYYTFEVKQLPMPEDFVEEKVIVGGYTRIGLSSLMRFIRKDVLISVDGCAEPPSSLAKDYLTIEYGRGPRFTTEQRQAVEGTISPHPLYSNPSTFEHGVYIDIASCYWAILNTVGWDLDYFPGRWLAAKRKPISFPWHTHKVARNCLVSVASSTSIPLWSPEQQLYSQPSHNRLLNRGLYCLINDVLNAIAWDAIRLGVVYVHTDGYIAPSEKVAQKLEQLINDWGLWPRRKAEGKGWVASSQSFRVGSYVSKNISAELADTQVVRAVPYAGWLQRRMSKLASKRQLQRESILAVSPSTEAPDKENAQ